MKSEILIIEDDIILGESLIEYLSLHGFHVSWIFDNFQRMHIDVTRIALIILDLLLPGIPGEDILIDIRSRNPSIPILILTTKSALDSKRFCFTQGADDYLVKPFDMEELILRIHALLKRTPLPSREGSNQRDYVILGDCVIDFRKHVLTKGNKEIHLSRRAWDLLVFLAKNRGRIVPKEEILKHVWYDAYVTEGVIRAYIKELRKILPPGSVETFKGRGYRLR